MFKFVELGLLDFAGDCETRDAIINLDSIASLDSDGYFSDGKVTLINGEQFMVNHNGVSKIKDAIKTYNDEDEA